MICNLIWRLVGKLPFDDIFHPIPELNTSTINKLLTALNECTEWGQVFILDSLSNYNPKDDREAQSICERITPRLAHANAAVVLSAVKVDGFKLSFVENYVIMFFLGIDENDGNPCCRYRILLQFK